MLLESGHGFLDFLGVKPQRAVLHYYYYSHWTDISFLVHISVYLPVSPCWTQRFKSDPGVNFTVFRAGIRIVSCVLGFLPIRSLDTDTEKVPNPTSCILPPLSSSSDTALQKAFNTIWVTFVGIPDSSAIRFYNSSLFILWYPPFCIITIHITKRVSLRNPDLSVHLRYQFRYLVYKVSVQ